MADTSPSDRARIELLSGGDPYRELMLEKMFEVAQEASANKAWRQAHDESDRAHFAAIDVELAQIKTNAGSVSVSVQDLESDRTKVIASWRALAWGIGALATLSLAISWIGEKVLALWNTKP